MADGQVTPVASSRSSSPAPSDDDDDDDDVSGSESSKAPNERKELMDLEARGDQLFGVCDLDHAFLHSREFLGRSPTRSEAEAYADDADAFKESHHVTTASDQVSIKYDDESGNEVCTQPAALAHA